MAKAEHREGFEFTNSDRSIWLTLPVYELSSASIEEVRHELLGWVKVDEVFIHAIMCRRAYRQKRKMQMVSKEDCICTIPYHRARH